MTRTADKQRQTAETQIELSLDLDGGEASAETGVGFLDHMLDLLARHGRLGLKVKASGDLEKLRHFVNMFGSTAAIGKEGRLHLAEGEEELAAGAAFRLRPRQVHVVENAGASEMTIIGIFTPAGSPSAAYLTADIAAEYRIA